MTTPTSPSSSSPVDAYGCTDDAWARLLKEWKEPAFRTKQIRQWLSTRWIRHWDEASNLPATLREKLKTHTSLEGIRPVIKKNAGDHTDKYLFRLQDGALIETVLIRAPMEGVGQENSRDTLCLSTQVGCAYGCKFCASGLAGFKRNLSPGEIFGQVTAICHDQGQQARKPDGSVFFDNIVIMGMGEPLANYNNLMEALRLIHDPSGMDFGARRITVSTSGLVPQIYKLAEEDLPIRLAISLHGASNEVREKIMPVNRKYPLEALIQAASAFRKARNKMITLEYILIEDVNDMREQAQRLANIARELRAHINLIPYNKVEGLPWKRPNIQRQKVFTDILKEQGARWTIRREKGHDIAAACGQLRLQQEKEEQSA